MFKRKLSQTLFHSNAANSQPTVTNLIPTDTQRKYVPVSGTANLLKPFKADNYCFEFHCCHFFTQNGLKVGLILKVLYISDCQESIVKLYALFMHVFTISSTKSFTDTV